MLLTPEGTHVTEEARPVLDSIANKQRTYEISNPDIRILGRTATEELIELNHAERTIINELSEIDLEKFGIDLPVQGGDVDPNKLVDVSNQKIIRLGKTFTVGDRYTTPNTFNAFAHMSKDMKRKIGRPLVLQTGYRAPTYQALLFARNLSENGYDLDSTVSLVTPPGRSEHANIDALALDIMPFETVTRPYTFEDMPEYEWMSDNAESYDFYLSYPPDNAANMIFEPWHWVHRSK